MLNTKRLLSLFVVVLMIGTVSLTTFNSSSSTCVSYADDEDMWAAAPVIEKAVEMLPHVQPMVDQVVTGVGILAHDNERVRHVVDTAFNGAVAGAVGGATFFGGPGAVVGAVTTGVTNATIAVLDELNDIADNHGNR